jgi:hypothetical protein
MTVNSDFKSFLTKLQIKNAGKLVEDMEVSLDG